MEFCLLIFLCLREYNTKAREGEKKPGNLVLRVPFVRHRGKYSPFVVFLLPCLLVKSSGQGICGPLRAVVVNFLNGVPPH
jgi:hypothetical protein